MKNNHSKNRLEKSALTKNAKKSAQNIAKDSGFKHVRSHKSKKNSGSKSSFKSSYTYQAIANFFQSFTPRRTGLNFFHVFFLDLVFITLFFGMIYAGQQIGSSLAEAPSVPSDLSNINADNADAVAAQLHNIYLFTIIGPIVFFLAFTLLFSLLGGVGFCLITRQKFTLAFFWRFLLLNFAWLGLWSGLFMLVVYLSGTEGGVGAYLSSHPVVTNVSMIFLVVLFLHLSIVLYPLFTLQPKVSSVWKALAMAFFRIHYFVLPYLLIFALAQVLRLVDFGIKLLPQTTYLIIALTVLILFFVWTKFYTASVVLENS